MKIIQPRKHHREVFLRLAFRSVQSLGCGWSFECDDQGNVDVESLNSAARRNYDICVTGRDEDRDEDIRCIGVERNVHSWVEPAIGQCDCGDEVVLDGFTCTCERCGADYNSSGQRLAPREQWGKETGEHLADILRIR